jgi:hypothetical protein
MFWTDLLPFILWNIHFISENTYKPASLNILMVLFSGISYLLVLYKYQSVNQKFLLTQAETRYSFSNYFPFSFFQSLGTSSLLLSLGICQF